MGGQYDLHDNIKAVRSISPVAGAATGKIIDRSGFAGVEILMSYGAVTATNATIIPVLKEGDVTGTMTSVADGDMIGLELNASIGQAATRTSGVSKNVTKRLGYKGAKRYVSVNTLQTVTAAAINGADVLLGAPVNAPVAT
jgi:hypothetical protein